jgi:hypothetical protein
MDLIKNNPYRIIGLLVGATAREQTRQINRLKRYIEAEQDPQDDFSFPVLGDFHRTIESVEEAATKLNLDNDKINAALFWFWNGNPNTDEVAFDALKDGNIDYAIELWRNLIYNSFGDINEISKRNASAFFNLSTLYLNEYYIDSETLQLKLHFLESEFVKDFKSVAVDETYNIGIKDLQLKFLNILINQNNIDHFELVEAVYGIDFVAKEEFLNGFIQKQIEQIEHKIETAKNKRKANKANAAKAGKELYSSTAKYLTRLKNIVSITDFKYTSISDKVSNEILQCSIDYFNYCQEKESSSDYVETAMKLAKQAKKLAIGKLTKDRVKDSIETLKAIKEKELSQAIAVLKSIKAAYEEACRKIDKQVDDLQYVKFGDKRLPITNVSINWSKVEELKRNCLDWDKVTDLVHKHIPQQNIEKIKRASSKEKINEYKNLVNFLMSKISITYKSKVAYLSYWEEVNLLMFLGKIRVPVEEEPAKTKTSSSSSTIMDTPTTNTSSSSDFKFAPNAWWILALVGYLFGGMIGGAGGSFVGAFLGWVIGSLLKE